jgi:hypothetical protein
MWEKAMKGVTAKDGDSAQKVTADLQNEGHNVSLREVQRTFARARASLESSSDPWHIENATSVEELDLILPVIASRLERGRDIALSIEEAKVILSVRRAAPNWEPWQVDQFAQNYRAARHTEWPSGPGSPWTAANLEAFLALVHRERTQPGTLQKAIDARQVPAFGFVGATDSVAPDTSARKRKGGAGHGKTSTR